MDPLRDPEEFGRVVATARGYVGEKKPAFSQRMGTSIPTLTRWESGEVASIGRTVPQRRQLAERIIESTGCPSSWFGLSEPSEAVEAELRRLIDELASQVTELQLDLATVQTDLADARKHQGLAEHVPEATGG